MAKIVVTSALPYANGSIHIGHLVEYIQTDIFVRFLKLKGEDVIYCCADDAHGTPIEVNAKKLGIKPEELIANAYEEHTKDFKDFLINFDSYHTTNSSENKALSDQVFTKLKDKGLIIKKTVDHLYCENCQRFLPDRFVKGKCPKCEAVDQYGDVCEKCGTVLKSTELIDPKCSICATTPILKPSEHYFFQLKKCEAKLKDWLTNNKNLQQEVKNYVLNWIKDGLDDWCISRDGPYFGFKIPGEEDKYYYVWLDAPIGYIASTKHYCKKNDCNFEDYWKGNDSRIIHFIGKDIVYFHFLFWPAILMESGFNLPETINVHGFLTVNGEKMSKSRGTFFTAREFLKLYNPEYLRYYYANFLGKKADDIDLSFDDFIDRVNNELVANLGNFCYRILSFSEKNFGSKLEKSDNPQIIKEIEAKIEHIGNCYNEYDIKSAIREIMAISAIGNKYLQDNEPWKLIKEDKEKAEAVLGTCAKIAKNLAILISPIMPIFSKELRAQLGVDNLSWKNIGFDDAVFELKGIKPLIEKIEKTQNKVFPLDLKVAKIIEVKEHPEAEKLYVMQIDLGTEMRQIVAGIRKRFTPKELVGKHIVVVTNLKPAKLRGFESQAMLLAGSLGEKIELVLAEKSEPGTQVVLDGYDINTARISIDDFAKVKLEVKSKVIFHNGVQLLAGKEQVRLELDDGAKIR